MDFTIKRYLQLINSLKKADYSFQTVSQFIRASHPKPALLRHDIDRLPLNSLHFVRIQAEMGITGTYYFRVVPESFDEKIIKEIYLMGHEVGYHYEDFVFARQKAKGKRQKEGKSEDYEKYLAGLAIESFKENLAKLRRIVPVKTICMHGSPMSSWDSKLLWKYYDYHDFGIVWEPYFDINFNDMLYLTDTGRRWDGGEVSIRDKGLGIKDMGLVEDYYKEWKVKPVTGSLMKMSQESVDFQNKFKFRSTQDIIRSQEKGELPDRMMITFHPQRWMDSSRSWVKELIWQNVKNVGKYFLIKLRD
jgi:hypothetical protein